MEKRHFYLESELDAAIFPVACIYKNSFLQEDVFFKETDPRALNCVQNCLLNLMVCGFQSELKPFELISKIKAAVPEVVKGASYTKDLISFLMTDEFFKDVQLTTEQPKLHRFVDILIDTDKTLISYDTKSGRHCSYVQLKDNDIYADGVKIPFDIVAQILQGKTTFVVFLKERKNNESTHS